jgi:hypothetical protein
MKAYLITTGALFGLLALVHVWRVIDAERELATDPWYILVALVAAAMSVWAFRLLRHSTRRDQ